MVERQRVLRLTRKDFEIEQVHCQGHGGQNINKVKNGVRMSHKESGVTVKCCDTRSYPQNLKLAFERLTSNPKFMTWLKMEHIKQVLGLEDIERQVEREMAEENLVIEVVDPETGKWVKMQ